MSNKVQFEVKVSADVRYLTIANLMLLPESMKNAQVGAMLSEAATNPALARKLEEDAKAVFAECGVAPPEGTTIHVHRSTPHAIHLVVPHMPLPPKTELSDDDLLSEGLVYGAEKQATAGKGPYIPKGKWGGDDGGGDHGDLGTGSNNYNSGNYVDRSGALDDK